LIADAIASAQAGANLYSLVDTGKADGIVAVHGPQVTGQSAYATGCGRRSTPIRAHKQKPPPR
jgi:hypothetical protein